jgi:membrane-bound metal-dependent hydrolase YbcI (DUF457 family)
VAPDLDFLPGLLVGRPVLYHQGESHSLLVALAVSLVVALVLVRDRRLLLRGWAVFFAAYVSHLVLDYLGSDARPPIGIPLLWPASDATWVSPVAILPGIHHSVSGTEGTGEWLAMVFSGSNVGRILAELAVVGPLLLFAGLKRRRRQGRARAVLGGRRQDEGDPR